MGATTMGTPEDPDERPHPRVEFERRDIKTETMNLDHLVWAPIRALMDRVTALEVRPEHVHAWGAMVRTSLPPKDPASDQFVDRIPISGPEEFEVGAIEHRNMPDQDRQTCSCGAVRYV